MSALITEERSTAAATAIGIGSGLLMGSTIAAVTGCFLVRMLQPR